MLSTVRAAVIRTTTRRMATGAAGSSGGAEASKNASRGALARHGIQKRPADLTDDEWKAILTPQEYHVARQAGTERPHTGEYAVHSDNGVYTCLCCGADLFRSESKFNSGCGWPSFYEALGAEGKDETKTNIKRLQDNSIPEMPRTEIRCKQCNAHLGHVFSDGPKPTGERFCVNSCTMDFKTNQ